MIHFRVCEIVPLIRHCGWLVAWPISAGKCWTQASGLTLSASSLCCTPSSLTWPIMTCTSVTTDWTSTSRNCRFSYRGPLTAKKSQHVLRCPDASSFQLSASFTFKRPRLLKVIWKNCCSIFYERGQHERVFEIWHLINLPFNKRLVCLKRSCWKPCFGNHDSETYYAPLTSL